VEVPYIPGDERYGRRCAEVLYFSSSSRIPLIYYSLAKKNNEIKVNMKYIGRIVMFRTSLLSDFSKVSG